MIPPDARPAFCGPDGAPYRSWREIVGGNAQPRVAFLEGRFWSVAWSGYEATREEMPPGSWLVEDRNGGVRIISETEFADRYGSA